MTAAKIEVETREFLQRRRALAYLRLTRDAVEVAVPVACLS